MKTKSSCTGKPKRPPTACILFTNEFKKRNHQLKKVTEISKAAAKEWKSLDAIGKAPYYAEYKKLMEVYEESKKVNNNNCADTGYERKPKRPSTAFFLYQQKYKQMHPELTKVVEISKAAGKEWRRLGVAEQAPFFAEYEKLMDAYMKNQNPTKKTRAAPPRCPCPCPCRCCRRRHVPAAPLSSPPPPQAACNSRAVASTFDGSSRTVAWTFDALNCENVNDYSNSEWTGLKHEGELGGEPSSLRSVKKSRPRRGGLKHEGELGGEPSSLRSVKKSLPRRGGLKHKGELGGEPSSPMWVKKPRARRGGLKHEGELGGEPSSPMWVKKPRARRGCLKHEGELGGEPSSPMSVKKPRARRGV